MSKVVSHKVCLRMICKLHASYNITNLQRYENTMFSWIQRLLKKRNIFQKVITSSKKICTVLHTFFLFFLFKDWVLETQLKVTSTKKLFFASPWWVIWFFLFEEKMFRSWDIYVSAFLWDPQNLKSVASS